MKGNACENRAAWQPHATERCSADCHHPANKPDPYSESHLKTPGSVFLPLPALYTKAMGDVRVW